MTHTHSTTTCRLLVLLTLLALSLLTQPARVAATTSTEQKNALLDLYQTTGGAHWTWLVPSQKWAASSDPCLPPYWEGVQCSNVTSTSQDINGTNRVLSLNLTAHGLSGPLPDSLYVYMCVCIYIYMRFSLTLTR